MATSNVVPLRPTQPIPFNPEAWLAAWGDAGGLAALIGDRLMIGRLHAIDKASHWRLDELRRSVMSPANASAVFALLASRAMPEAEL